MNLPALSAFLALSLLHLVFCLNGWKAGRLFTKPLLVPALLCAYLLSAVPPHALVVLALLCGFVGDVALELPGADALGAKPSPAMLAGLGAFFMGHVFYIVLFLGQLERVSPLRAALPAAMAVGVFFLVFRSLYPKMGAMLLPGTAYLLVLLVMACAAALSGAPGRVLGGALFVVSDVILARSILLGRKKYSSFVVMLTYLAAQLLLVESLL